MKILFVDHPQYISGSMRLWQGLSEMLPGSVTLYPHVATHYGVESFDLAQQPWFQQMSAQAARGELPQGIPPFAPGEGLTGGGQTVIMHEGLVFKPPMPERPPDEDEVVRMLQANHFDLIVLANSNRVPTFALARLRDRVGALPPIVYYDAGERDELNEHWIHVFRPSIVFKQILTPEVLRRGLSVQIGGYTLKMFPLPLSNMFVDHPDFTLGSGNHDRPVIGKLRASDGPSNKEFDMFYYLGETWPTRRLATEALDELRVRRGFSYTKGVCFEAYNVVLSKSRLAVSMRGSGRDTTRYWEIPGYRTALVADGTMGCIHPYPFTHDETAIFYDSVQSLISMVDKYLSDTTGRLDAIAQAGKLHLWRYHSTAARCVFFLDRIRETLGISPDETQNKAISLWKVEHAWKDNWEGPVVSANV